MPEIPVTADGKLVANIMHFARALRAAGLRVGPGRVADAVAAAEAAGFSSRRDFYWVLHACFVSRAEHRAVFDAAFELFWRDPQVFERMLASMLREVRGAEEEARTPKAAETRAREAMLAGTEPPPPPPPAEEPGEEIEFDARFTFSAEERLRKMDFEQMTTAEMTAAKAAIARLRLPVEPLAGRRRRPAASGPFADWRASLRASLRRGGEITELKRRDRQRRWPNLVALADISGSMSAYSRILLHFLHSVANAQAQRAATGRAGGWAETHSFVFGTRLTNITRHLRRRDVDDALKAAGAEAEDWEGGTRIGACLHAFNRDWSRRVLGQGAVVLLITDGLERDDPDQVAREAERLRLSSLKLIWLNPLLRWDGFAPRARGVRALLPQVDSFRAAHNIESLEALAAALTASEDQGARPRQLALLRGEEHREAGDERR